ncbi:MAG: ATP-binding protein [Candidatus Amesbacteria bacterium]|nr:ATP-binding protein [Candidatus Amesbacteria bacterium]
MKQLLKSIVLDWWNNPLPIIIPREQSLLEYINLPIRKAICVTGFRRVGKTYLLYDLASKLGKENCVYINFEDERLPRTTDVLTQLLEVVTELMGNKGVILLMDEIQNIPKWSLWARRVLDSTPHQLFISGSSSQISSSELPTEMRGRSLSVHVSPLSLVEFFKFKNFDPISQTHPHILHYIQEYLTYGGFPEVILADEGKKPLILDEYFQTFMLRDLVERYHLRNVLGLKLFLKLLIDSPYFTLSKMANNIKSQGLEISKPTLSRYLEYFKSSYFVSPLYLHTASLKNRYQAAQKPYFVDSGFVSRLSAKFSLNQGRLLEQLVYHKLASGDNVYYWQDYSKHEVDFVVRNKESVTHLVQACHVSEGEIIPEREIPSLIKAAKEFYCHKLTLVTWDMEQTLKVSGETIEAIPLWKFLS